MDQEKDEHFSDGGTGSLAPEDTERPPDGALVQRFLAGRLRAFEELVRRHQGRVYRFCLGMVSDPHTAEDLTQMVFLKAATNLPSLRNPDAFASWLSRLARHTVIDHLRRRSRRGFDREEPLAEPAGPSQEPDAREAVRKVLQAMSAADREVLLLADLLGLNTRELAAHLDVGASAAKMRLARARERFRALYRRVTEGDHE